MFLCAKHFYIFYKKEMKKFLKWFTLVEILIVIVIIGILISALVPRMSAAQGRARDVARKNDLSNLQAAIIVAYQDLWRYPCTNSKWCKGWDETEDSDGVRADSWVNIHDLKSRLEAAWMNTVPLDPLATNDFYGIWMNRSSGWNYRYITMKSNWVTDWWFALMAKTEVAWWSNWVVCLTTGGTLDTWGILSGMDSKTLKLCQNITKSGACSNNYGWTCTYKNEEDLRYVMLY